MALVKKLSDPDRLSSPFSPQDDVERAGPAMPGVGGADAGDGTGVWAVGQPMADLRADRAACASAGIFRWIPWASGDDQDNADVLRDGEAQEVVEPLMRGGQRIAVQVDGLFRHDAAAANLPFPTAVQNICRALRYLRSGGGRLRRC